MGVYLLELCLLIISGVLLGNLKSKNEKSNKLFFIVLSFVTLTFIAGFRTYQVGADTWHFVASYNNIYKLNINQFGLYRYEWGFTFLSWILGRISNNYTLLLFVTSLFVNYSVLRFVYKHSNNIYVSVLLYFLAGVYFCYMNIMRQALAIGVLLFGFDYLLEKKHIKFVITVFIASLFHESALICLILLFASKLKINKKNLFLIISSTLFIFIFGNNIFNLLAGLSVRLEGYRDSAYFVSNYFGAVIEFLVNLFVFIFCLNGLRKDKNKDNELKNRIINYELALGMIFAALTIRINIFVRFIQYFNMILIIGIPNALSVIDNKKNRQFLTILIILIYIIYWLMIMVLRPEWSGTNPYSSVLFN